MTTDLLRRWGPWAALILAAAILLLAGPMACKRAARLEAERRVAREQQKSAATSARDAVATVGTAATRERRSDDLTTTNQREIRDAQGANLPVHADAAAAGLDGLCRRAAYRDGERCRLRRAAAR